MKNSLWWLAKASRMERSMHRKRKKKFRFLRTLLLLTMIVCLIPVGQAYYLSFKHEKQQEKLRNILVKSTEKKEPEKEILRY